MNMQEVGELLDEINDLYYGVGKEEDPMEKLKRHYKYLKDVPTDVVHRNLEHFVRTSKTNFPPTVRDLMRVEESGPYVPSYDDSMFKLYVDKNFDKVVDPDTLQVVDYIPKKEKTAAQKEQESIAFVVNTYHSYQKMFNQQPPESLQKRYDAYKLSHPELVAEETEKFMSEKAEFKKMDTVNIHKLREDREKGERRLAEIRNELNNQ